MKTKKNKVNRRTFLKTAGIVSASLAVPAGFAGNVSPSEPANNNYLKKMPTRILGKTGIPVSILSLGGGVNWMNNQSLLKLSLNMGINYWDTAHNYISGKSELGIGHYLEKYPEDRKKIFIATKAEAIEPKGMAEQLNTSFERLKIDYIDWFGLHMVDKPEILSSEVKAWAEQKKKEGKIRFFGFSCHANMSHMLKHASNLGWIDSITCPYNYNLMNDDDIKRGIDACYRSGIGMVAMKSQGLFIDRSTFNPLGTMKDEDLVVTESFLAKGYTLQQAKLKVVWTNEKLTTCLSEITNINILKDNVAAATDNVQLSGSDMDMLNRLSQSNRGLYCKGCMQCESVMSSESRINDILRYMMYYKSYCKRDDARRLFKELPEKIKRNIDLKDYSPAERICPNNIQIGQMMREAVRILA